MGMGEPLDNYDNLVFDGELFKKGGDRLESNAVATKFVRGTASKDDNKNVRIVLWDVIDFDDWIAGSSKIEYTHRLWYLRLVYNYMTEHTIKNMKPKEPIFCTDAVNNTVTISYNDEPNIESIISIAHTKEFDDIDSVIEFNYQTIRKGLEGIIVKNKKGYWSAKRSNDTLKMKEELESELLVLDIQEGQGKYKGKCGALLCSSADGKVVVSVGTGLNDAQREAFKPNNPDDKFIIIGQIITVRHNGIIQNASGSYSLYLPRFVEIRQDRNEADTLDKIKNEGKTL